MALGVAEMGRTALPFTRGAEPSVAEIEVEGVMVARGTATAPANVFPLEPTTVHGLL